ncbi:MAG: Unknown protein [uncultured Sulfurovum sp.]|uniref:Cell division protein ZapB n=1 Tax=uncultured Sulfurovum sp. TaxID=269237 RepID=A0A6S6TRG8_9BACT|nr:MAG: Unknown protein [uncultured Sulfurovum sp.]
MIKKTVLEELDNKISLILEKHNELKEENRLLKETLVSSRETEARLRQEILKLKEEDEMKDLELEDIALRISKSMGVSLNHETVSMAS